MGVGFTWKPADPRQGTSFASGSSLNTALENAFGGFPMTLGQNDIQVLKGMSYSGLSDLDKLIQAICDHDKVVVEAHW